VKDYILPVLTACLLTAAIPGSAQSVTGQVAVHGFVAPRCGSSPTGDTSFSGSIHLGELSQTDGTLSGLLAGSTAASPAGLAAFVIGCSGITSIVTLSATRLSNPVAAANPGSSNDVDFTVHATMALAAGGFATVNYVTAQALPAPTTQTIPGAFAFVLGNLEISVFGLTAENGAASILVAGDYDSTITFDLAPEL
jgi:hypothetical protein